MRKTEIVKVTGKDLDYYKDFHLNQSDTVSLPLPKDKKVGNSIRHPQATVM